MQFDASFWSVVKDRIRSINKDNKLIESFVDPIVYVETQGTQELPRLILGVPSTLHQYFVVENLFDKIYTEISRLAGKNFEVDIVVSGNKAPHVENPFLSGSTDSYEISDSVKTVQQPNQSQFNVSRQDVLNPDYTFSTVVVGRNSEFAHAASYNVAQNPAAEGYNPMFICGPPGMGKTHLLHAVGNQIRVSFPQLRITYISAERFQMNVFLLYVDMKWINFAKNIGKTATFYWLTMFNIWPWGSNTGGVFSYN